MSNEIAEVVDAGSLASFETVQKEVQVVPVRWSIEKFRVAQEIALSGKTKTAIAKELGIPLTAINTWLKNNEFQEYINQTVLDGASLLKAKKLQLLTKTLAAREAEAELNGYASFSNKDSLDIISEIRKETGDERTADSSYTSLLEKLVSNSMKQPKTLIVESINE
jgi:transposase-like protein